MLQFSINNSLKNSQYLMSIAIASITGVLCVFFSFGLVAACAYLNTFAL
jgi:hypothetical protein